MFMINFVIAHVLNTFELVTEQIVNVGKDQRTFDIEKPLPANAAPDARAHTFRLTLYSRPSLMKMWQANLSEEEARRALIRGAVEADTPLSAEAVDKIYLSSSVRGHRAWTCTAAHGDASAQRHYDQRRCRIGRRAAAPERWWWWRWRWRRRWWLRCWRARTAVDAADQQRYHGRIVWQRPHNADCPAPRTATMRCK